MAETESTEQDGTRRDFIFISAGIMTAVGAGAAVWPLIDQMNPDATAQALASIEVDLDPIQEGQAITVMWRGKPIFIRNRTAEEIEEAKTVEVAALPDEAARILGEISQVPATDQNRTLGGENENWLVLVGICTHLGCIPKGQRLGDTKGEYNGWFCPCHGSHYDTSGRIRKGPAPENMAVPPYSFTSPTKITIG
ncbi:MAG: ubiquinol-cytochrome c reductase iron-sulfur subunit [Pseudomonadota bacterium]